MAVKNVILDYDGTLTDIKQEAESFVKEFPIVFAQYLGVDPEKFVPSFNDYLKYTALSKASGFFLDGHDAAPANAYPHLTMQATAQTMAELIRKEKLNIGIDFDKNKIPNDLGELAVDLFKKTYSQINHSENLHFREGIKGTKKFLDTLLERGYATAIVTTSSTDRVLSQISQLGTYPELQILGGAEKLRINPEFTSIPEFTRPVEFYNKRKPLLRRKKYYDALNQLAAQGFDSKNTVVVGDSYELDLALPEYLGYSVIQIKTPYTLDHEVKYHNRKGNPVVKNYRETLDAIARV